MSKRKGCPFGIKVGNKCKYSDPSIGGIKIKCKNFWKDKNICLGLTRPDAKGKRIVAIGEEFEPNAYKFIHIDIDTFIDFADKVKKVD